MPDWVLFKLVKTERYIMIQLSITSILLFLSLELFAQGKGDCENLNLILEQRQIEYDLIKDELKSIKKLATKNNISDALYLKLFTIQPSMLNRDTLTYKIQTLNKELGSPSQEEKAKDPCAKLSPEFSMLEGEIQKTRKAIVEKKVEILNKQIEILAQNQSMKAKTNIDFFKGVGPEDRAAFVYLKQLYQDLIKNEQQWLDELQERTSLDAKTLQMIEDITNHTRGGLEPNSAKVLGYYAKVKGVWQGLIDQGIPIFRMFQSDSSISIKNASEFPLSGQALETYKRIADQIATEATESQIRKRDAFEDQISHYLKSIEDVSELRASLLGLIDMGLLLEVSGTEFLNDILREIIAVPVRFLGFVQRRLMNILNDFDRGLSGLWSLFQKGFILLLLLLIPYGVRHLTKRIDQFLNEYRKQLIMSRHQSRKAYRSSLLYLRLIPYTPWVTYLIAVASIAYMVQDTVYQDIIIALPLFSYFFLYKIFRLAIYDLVSLIQSMILEDQINTKTLVNSTSKIVGRFYLISFSVLHLTESTVDQGLIYGQISALMFILGLLTCAWAAYGWKSLIIPLCGKTFPEKMAAKVQELCSGRFSIFFCLPVFFLILIVLILDYLWDWLSEWEIVKKYFAKLYRRKIESRSNGASSSNDQLPEDYKQIFSYDYKLNESFVVPSNQEKIELIFKEIEGWLTEKEEDQSIIIYGDKGIGKTIILDKIESKFSDLEIIRSVVPTKISDKDALSNYLSNALGQEKNDNLIRMIMEFDKSNDNKKMILIDDAHNLFLGKVGGFEALKTMISLVNLNSENIFWVLTFNSYSWFYLKGVLSGNNYFRTEVGLERWSDESIRQLILSRHESSSYKLSYDQIMANQGVSKSGLAKEYAEEQFFRLLWEQANGNPRVALYLWVGCLKLSFGKYLRVGLPESPKLQKLNQLDDTSWFVLSTVVSHENLTRKEIADSINISMGEVSHAIKSAVENKLLHKGKNNRYRIGFMYQQDLVRQLKIKNFIYGIN